MNTQLQVLSENEKEKVHEATLKILSTTGIKVETTKGRRILVHAGAEVNEETHIVRFPRSLVEEALRLAPKKFSLGARRKGWDLSMNSGDCVLCMDGEGVSVIDRGSGDIRPSGYQDWKEATRLGDMLDEVGVYWSMVAAHDLDDTPVAYVDQLIQTIRNFSKHIQEPCSSEAEATWFKEVLQIVFGDKKKIKEQHPWSFLLCPQSPLIIDEVHTDAYLALAGWDIPVAVMPMPLMGTTAPGSMVSTVILGNCEVLAMLCLLQAAAPRTPFIYAPALSLMDPRSGDYLSGAVENGVLGAAETEMARYYNLPAESSGLSTSHYVPSIQSGYERAQNGLLTALSWPDIMVGPGLLGGSMVLSLEQFLIDVEIFKMCKKAHRGILSTDEKWLEDVISSVGPGAHFTAEESTVEAIHAGEWYMSDTGLHETYEAWVKNGKPHLTDEMRDKANAMLSSYESLPLSDEIEKELTVLKHNVEHSILNE